MDLSPSNVKMIARALEMDPALVPLANDLFDGFDDLGSDAGQILDILESLTLPCQARVLDLGCGKGSACLEIAASHGLACTGVDLYPPFIQAAQARAKQAKLPAYFQTGDIRDPNLIEGSFDVVMMLAVGDILGNQSQDIELARTYCRPGGYMLISDGYLVHKKSPTIPGFERYSDRASTLRLLERHGDRLVDEWGFHDDGSDDTDAALLEESASTLAVQHPQLALKLAEFIQSQYDTLDWMTEHFVDCTWVLQRA